MQEKALLRYVSNRTPPRRQVVVCERSSIDQYASVLRPQQPDEHVGQRRLAGARCTYERGRAADGDRQRDIVDGLAGSGRIGIRNVLEAEFTAVVQPFRAA